MPQNILLQQSGASWPTPKKKVPPKASTSESTHRRKRFVSLRQPQRPTRKTLITVRKLKLTHKRACTLSGYSKSHFENHAFSNPPKVLSTNSRTVQAFSFGCSLALRGNNFFPAIETPPGEKEKSSFHSSWCCCVG